MSRRPNIIANMGTIFQSCNDGTPKNPFSTRRRPGANACRRIAIGEQLEPRQVGKTRLALELGRPRGAREKIATRIILAHHFSLISHAPITATTFARTSDSSRAAALLLYLTLRARQSRLLT